MEHSHTPVDIVTQLWLRHFMSASLVEHTCLRYKPMAEYSYRKLISGERSTSLLVGSRGEGLSVPEYLLKSVGGSRLQYIIRDSDDMTLEPNCFEVRYQSGTSEVVSRGKALATETIEEAEPNYVKLTTTSEYREARIRAGTPIKRRYLASSEVMSSRQQSWKSVMSEMAESWEIVTEGPSLALLPGVNIKQDICRALHFDEWPELSREFSSRSRLSGWPDDTLIRAAIGCGHHVTPVGRPLSPNKSMEWRMSFSLAECVLARNLPDGSRVVYVYVKLLHTFFLKTPNGPSGLSTFSLKNVFFWICEKVPTSSWSESRLLVMIRFFLDELIHSLAQGVIKHYFIPTANLICDLPLERRMVLAKIIKHMKDSLLQYLKEIDAKIRFADFGDPSPLSDLKELSRFEHCHTWQGINVTSLHTLVRESLCKIAKGDLFRLRTLVEEKERVELGQSKCKLSVDQLLVQEIGACNKTLGTLADLYERETRRKTHFWPFAIFVVNMCQELQCRTDLMLKILVQLHRRCLPGSELNIADIRGWLLAVLSASCGSNPQGIPQEIRDAVASLSQAYLDSICEDIHKKIVYSTLASVLPVELLTGNTDLTNLTPREQRQLELHYERKVSLNRPKDKKEH